MADEEKVRKTVSLTHRQIGATGLIGLAVALAPYLKETFVTRGEQAEMTVQMEYMRRDIAEIKTLIDSKSSNIIEQIREYDKRTVKTEDRLERRIDTLEAAIRPKQRNY